MLLYMLIIGKDFPPIPYLNAGGKMESKVTAIKLLKNDSISESKAKPKKT